MDTLRERVERALTNAVDNGYAEQLRCLNAEQLARDLITCDADLEDEAIEDIIPLAREWLGG